MRADEIDSLHKELAADASGLGRSIFFEKLGLLLFSMYMENAAPRNTKDVRFFTLLKEIVDALSIQPATRLVVVAKLQKCIENDISALPADIATKLRYTLLQTPQQQSS